MSYQRQQETKHRNEHKLHECHWRGKRGSYYFDTNKQRIIHYSSARILKYARNQSHRKMRRITTELINHEQYDYIADRITTSDLDPYD